MRYIIIDPDEGIFLGTREDKEMGGMGMLFSSHNFLYITRAVCWDNKDDARSYMFRHIKRHLQYCFIAEIDSTTKNKYVDIKDICNAGFGDYATDMIDALDMPSEAVH
tara:strand:+ start:1750 stop:2073 length:324 start_codon:yes stop_codon:yes gene_type:complete